MMPMFRSSSPWSRFHTSARMMPPSIATARPFHTAPSPPASSIRLTHIWVSWSDEPLVNGLRVFEREMPPAPPETSVPPVMKFMTSRSSSRPIRRVSAYALA